MKKLSLVLFSFFVLISCSDNDDSAPTTQQPNPNLLAEVVFNPGNATGERHWIFNADGLLTDIVKADGTVLKHFAYDENDNLAQYISDGTTTDFAYDSNNRLTSVGTHSVVYDEATQTYVMDFVDPDVATDYDYLDRYEYTVNADMLLTQERVFYASSDGDYDMTGTIVNHTANGNIGYISAQMGDMSQGFSYDDHVNPLRFATLKIMRTLGIYGFNNPYDKLFDGYSSSPNNLAEQHYAPEDPESHKFEYIYNANGLPQTAVIKHFYFGEIEGESTYANYYYQGDIQP